MHRVDKNDEIDNSPGEEYPLFLFWNKMKFGNVNKN